MKIKECYVSKNGITCFTNLNTMLTIKEIYNNKYLLEFKNYLFIYFKFRLFEFIVRDFIKNKNYLFSVDNENIKDNLLNSIIFN